MSHLANEIQSLTVMVLHKQASRAEKKFNAERAMRSLALGGC